MKHSLHIKRTLLICLIGIGFLANAQDIHFSQFNFSPLNLNPALAGVFKGNMRASGTYRSQWQSVPVPYMTFSGAFDMNYYHRRKFPNSIFGGGAVFHYDQAGDGEMSLSQFSLAASYTRRMSKQNFLTGGLMFSASQRALSLNQLSFDMQFNGELFNENDPTGEDGINSNVFFADLTAGVNWHHQNTEKRMRIDVGGALFHINQPNTSFYDNGEVKLRKRTSVYAIGQVMLLEDVDFLFRAMGQFQGSYQELILALGGRYHIDKTRTKELAIALNLGYRLDDAFVPSFEVDYKSWRVGFSYDINLSGFTEATGHRGGPEITVLYYYKKVEPMAKYKACPIF